MNFWKRNFEILEFDRRLISLWIILLSWQYWKKEIVKIGIDEIFNILSSRLCMYFMYKE